MRSSQIRKKMLVWKDQTERVNFDGTFYGIDSLRHDHLLPENIACLAARLP
jgi:hypothetical protein